MTTEPSKGMKPWHLQQHGWIKECDAKQNKSER